MNGVSRLHGEILREDTFRDFCKLEPDKFTSITNGITHRRWLMCANRSLTDLINESIGTDWVKDTRQLSRLLPFRDDPAFRDKFAAAKRHNKERFARFIEQRQGAVIDPDTLFDVQAKRLHEYKRQLLNAVHIMVLYHRIRDNADFTMQPRTFIFGAKASPAYYLAKQIIRMIISIGRMIERDERARKFLKVVFLENYDVSSAEVLIPAADLSEQLSTAGYEASGTGNMKFMMNGAVTMGTMDGANIEIYDQVGPDNIYIFGMRSNTVRDLRQEGSYSPTHIYETNAELRRALTSIIDGTLTPENPAVLQDIYHSLLFSDPYFVLKDFGSYSMAQRRVDRDYQDRDKWLSMAVTNTAGSGIFSSDRTIKEYNERIWHLK